MVRAALETIGDRNDRALFVEAAERGSRFFLAGFLDDGYCTEGSGYWKGAYPEDPRKLIRTIVFDPSFPHLTILVLR